MNEVIRLCIDAIKVFDEKNNANIIYDVKPLEPSRDDVKFLTDDSNIDENKKGLGEKKTCVDRVKLEALKNKKAPKSIYPDPDEKIYKKRIGKLINKDGSLKVDKDKAQVKESLKPFRLTRGDVKYLMSLGYEKSDIAQIQKAANSFKTVYDINGKRVTRDEAIKKLGREKFLNGLSRSAFHYSASQNADGIEVGFDSSKFFEAKTNENNDLVKALETMYPKAKITYNNQCIEGTRLNVL